MPLQRLKCIFPEACVERSRSSRITLGGASALEAGVQRYQGVPLSM
jgi:hypothetical protein